MLASLGAMREPTPRGIISEILDQMKQLHIARRALVKDRVATMNRAHTRRAALLKRQAGERLRQIEHQIGAIDAALRQALQARFDILVSIPGLGETTALAILIDMPELGQIEHKCVASLAGLAPMARDPGNHNGKRFIRGGRAQLRQAPYMPALVAMRCNPDLKAKYPALTAAGKPAKLALAARMRKLLILANALLRDGGMWTPNIT